MGLLVSIFASEFGWTIEYVLNLTRPQIRVMTEGLAKLNRMKNGVPAGEKRKVGKSVVSNKKTGSTDAKSTIMELLSIPGLKMSDKAKELFERLNADKQG